ncbi:MAG TPA: hypothetical protein VII41_03155, partial [Steroidobacteraceae bacterium]
MSESSSERRGQQLKTSGTRVEGAGEDRHQASQQVLQANGFGFRMVEPEERLGLGFAHLVVGPIQYQAGDQLQLLPRRRERAAQRRIEQTAEFAEKLADLG